MMLAGADAIYCSGGLGKVKALAREHIPVVGHTGVVPARATWIGGFKSVAKTADAAIARQDELLADEAAGAFALGVEVIPVEVATAVSPLTKLLLWSIWLGRNVTRNICSPKLSRGTNRASCPAMPRCIAALPLTIIGCRKNGLLHFANMLPIATPAALCRMAMRSG